MGEIFIGSEAVSRGELTRGELRRDFRAIYRDVYISRRAPRTLAINTQGAWLWSRRRAVVAGRAASALHGAEHVDDDAPVELIWNNNHAPTGLIVRNETLAECDVMEIDGMRVTTPARTAFDLARFLPRGIAVAHVDDLCRMTKTTKAEIISIAEHHTGARHVRRARTVIELSDAGAQTPTESRVRVLICDAGLPRPQTHICVTDSDGFVAFVDMGWVDPKVAVVYDGDNDLKDRAQYVQDIRNYQRLRELGWLLVIVVDEDKPGEILARVRAALIERGVISAETEATAEITRTFPPVLTFRRNEG